MKFTKMSKQRQLAWLGFVVVVVAGFWFFVAYKQSHPSTDDSYVQANVANISARVAGQVKTVNVKDNQYVKKGEVLFELDPILYQVKVKQAEATVEQQNSEYVNAKIQFERQKKLLKTNSTSQANYDTAQSQYMAAAAAVHAAEAELNQAKLNLSYTQVKAPADGYVSNFSLRPGDMLAQGDAEFALVESDSWWVQANYKETDLNKIRVNQPATIKIDMYPGQTFQGVVESISRGSGAVFSLLPAENATGNWIKVTQRFPVRIHIKNANPKFPLRVGASSVVTISTD